MDSESNSTIFYTALSRALHSIAAHLHRYRSELTSLEATIADIRSHLTAMNDSHNSTDDANGQVFRGLDQTASQVRAINDFGQELEKKIDNILALASNIPPYFLKATIRTSEFAYTSTAAVQSNANRQYPSNECYFDGDTSRHANVARNIRRDEKRQFIYEDCMLYKLLLAFLAHDKQP